MQATLVFVLLAVATADHDHHEHVLWNTGYGASIPEHHDNHHELFTASTYYNHINECAEVLELGNGSWPEMARCSAEVNTCFREVSELAPQCIHHAIPGHANKVHGHKAGHAAKAWFSAVCTFYEGVVGCMQRTPVYGRFMAHGQHGVSTGLSANTARDIASHPIQNPCWPELQGKLRECYAQAAVQCQNYKTCIGEEPSTSNDAILDRWYRINKELAADKNLKLVNLLKEIHNISGNQTSTESHQ